MKGYCRKGEGRKARNMTVGNVESTQVFVAVYETGPLRLGALPSRHA